MKINKNKQKSKIDGKKIIYIAIISVIIVVSIIIYVKVTRNNTYAKQANANEENQQLENSNIKISKADDVDIYKIIKKNNKESTREEIEIKEETLEFMTRYRENSELPKGTIQVVQEGREGIQQYSIKTIYVGGKNVKQEIMGSRIIKASADKIVEIGTANYTYDYKAKVGDKIYVTSDRAEIMSEPNNSSRKVTVLAKNEELKILEIANDWYRISSSSTTGWIKQLNATYLNPNDKTQLANQRTKAELLKELNMNMSLNKPSGLSLEQFKKVLSDPKDVNKIFEKNAEYFYYIEKQYNINGIFVAAIGIHESAWGTSKIAKDKNNLFGYGAYDSNPYNGAYTFNTYAESIDLMARVLTKYYLNPAGTSIFGGERAKGTFYNGATVNGVNKRYATDKNWANCVYKYIKLLYEKV